ncbi:quinolinate synthetase [Caloranaerobacter azorensis DSM 13643]|uniref:Quinolinate synthase n=1 Tax=Caloranaerobacter azorensis DSM 13643 TaxID=1121264 RepID=A0A1M5RGK2_9FIRM|nr:quinolinate synthase NadA [Caloranaerobacter azorensis]SHH25462.1 quinolinate synthetase [Caloranaerobacter azorensis DSM 13643]
MIVVNISAILVIDLKTDANIIEGVIYMDKQKIIDEIIKLKREKDAIILAHNYQIPEVQEIADVVGDSLALSRAASNVDNKMIVFCGVHFMAESAKILSPDKKVLLPAKDAGCPMADMVTAEKLREYKEKNPDTYIVCYVNSSAAVKAECDICCTSSNALKVVSSVDAEKILFVPDRNLGNYVKNKVKDKQIDLWPGFCITHHRVKESEVIKAKEAHPDALVLVHPECNENVVKMADFVGSTSQIIEFATKSSSKKFIIGTEMGILHQLRKLNPDKRFYLLSPGFICANMKKTGLNDVLNALKYERFEITVPEDIRAKALTSLQRMMDIK